MTNNKTNNWNFVEKVGLSFVLVFILISAILRGDSVFALISAICGITYTFLAGKGLPICYLFGVAGSSFYSMLAFQNLLWGNLLLYAGYYVPMQILGFFKWKKNLKDGHNYIVKIKLSRKELLLLILILILLTIGVYYILMSYNDAHPILDSITTVFSVGGMYLTVRRAIEQWIFWMGVNALSLAMWIDVAMDGVRVFSTIVMWAVYLFLAVYFYIEWKKEISSSKIR